MPVTAKRTGHTTSTGSIQSFGNLTFTGTYVTGGILLNPQAIAGGGGSSPFGGATKSLQVLSPLGYIYTLVGTVAAPLLKIFTAANTELANGAAFPEATAPYVLEQGKV